MFDKYIIQDNNEAARKVAASNDRLAATLRENSEREVAARDRVDITLTEYLKLQKDIADLSEENRYLKSLCGKIGLPYNVPILKESIRKYTCAGVTDFMDFTRKFLIEFKCDMSMLSPEQKEYMTEHFVHAG